MRKILVLYFISIICISSFAQIVFQQGVTYRYNGKKPRTPLGNVYLMTSASPNGVLSDEESGAFTLQLKDLQMGSPIGSVKATKKGMIIFNQQTVDEWCVRKEPLCLVLCDADEFDRQRQNLIAIGEREAKKRYDKKLAEIEAKYKQESLEWYKRMSEADSALQDARKHIGEYADLMARIDESEIDTIAQRALELFRNGNIDEAIKMFEEGHFLKKLEQSKMAEQQADQLIKTAQEAKEKAQKAREGHVKNINAQIEAYKVQGSWQKAANLMKGLADILHTPYYLFQYAYFCNTKGVNMDDIEHYYQKVIDSTAESKKINVQHLYLHATAMGNLGIIYSSKGLIKQAEIAIKESIEGRRQYATTTNDPNDNNHVAWSLVTLGDFYIDNSRFNEAETCLKEAELIYNSIAKSYYNNNEFNYGRLYDKLGWLYLKLENLELSEDYYMKAWKEMSNVLRGDVDEPKYALTDMARILKYGLCQLYELKRELSECKKYFSELDSTCSHYYNRSPQNYENLYASFLYDEAVFYFDIENIEKSEAIVLRCLPIFRMLAQRNPHYLTSVARSLCFLGKLKLKLNNSETALSYLRESKLLFKQIMANYPEEIEDYIIILTLLEQCYMTMDNYEKSLETLHEKTELIKKLFEENPDEPNLLNDYVTTLVNLSYESLLAKTYHQAEMYANQALSIDSTVVIVYTNLAAALLFQGKYEEAEIIYRQYKDELKNSFLEDFKAFTEAGVIPKERGGDVEKIKRMLNE